MGGADNVIKKAQADFKKGEYRWAATVLNHVVFADPNNRPAKNLLADTYEQMGYQAESGPWRNFYLTGAKELREGVNVSATPNTTSPDIIQSLALETYLDYLGVRLNHPKAAGRKITLNMTLPDRKQKFVLYIENGVLNYTLGKHADTADAQVTLNRSVLDSINLRQITFEQASEKGQVTVEGNKDKFNEFISLLDTFEFWFDIVTPGKDLTP
jgi:alkyl sulfatase BDS1-like metallo-beta-lactamase superfamily hydrolase